MEKRRQEEVGTERRMVTTEKRRVGMSICVRFYEVHTCMIANILFVVKTPGSLDHDNHAG